MKKEANILKVFLDVIFFTLHPFKEIYLTEIMLINIKCMHSTAKISVNGTSMWYDVCPCVFVCVHLTHTNWIEGGKNYINEIVITSEEKLQFTADFCSVRIL